VQAGTFLVDVTAALQTAIDACFGSVASPNGGTDPGRLKNRALYIPNGGYRISDTLQIRALRGGHIFGAGRFATTIRQYAADKPIIRTNGCDYTVFEHFFLDNSQVANNTAIFEFDWDSTGGVALQSCTFRNLFFAGTTTLTVANGLRIGNSGYMGSENLIQNCFFIYCDVGLTTRNYNALQNIVLGGNFQACRIGIRVLFGSIANIYGTGFQNDIFTSGNNQVTEDGWDILILNSANDTAVVEACRTESMRFLASFNRHNVKVASNTIIPSRIGNWTANTPYALGAIVSAEGAPYICTTAGTSGGSQPTWTGTTVNDNTVVWTSYTYTTILADAGFIENNIVQFGRVSPGGSNDSQVILVRNFFSRDDYLEPTPYQGESTSPLQIHNIVQYPYQSGPVVAPAAERPGSWAPRFGIDLGYNALQFRAYSSMMVGFERGRTDPHFEEQNSVGLAGALSGRSVSGTNQVGKPLYLAGGAGTGSGAGGAVILRVAPAGSSGTSVNSWVTAATFAVDRTFSAVNGLVMRTATAADIASAAAAINGTGKKAGLVVFDTTNNRLMVASGGTTVSPWYVVDGSASVIPV